jgi:hypothetical protein
MKRSRTLRVYDTYNFIDKDPVIDEMRTRWQDSGHTQKWVASVSGLAPATISNWFGGRTRRPQVAACSAFMGALGYERRWVRSHEAAGQAASIARKKKLNGK